MKLTRAQATVLAQRRSVCPFEDAPGSPLEDALRLTSDFYILGIGSTTVRLLS